MKRLAATFVLLAVTSCGADGRPDVASPLPHVTAPSIDLLRGADQVGEVGSTLPIAVSVQVARAVNDRTPVANQLLLWIVTKGTGRVEIDTTRTDVHGMSEQHWTLGTFAADDSLEIWMISSAGKGLSYVSVGATATHGEAIPGREKCDPIALDVAADTAVRIVDSVQVYASDRYNNIWPYRADVAVEAVQFSGQTSGGIVPSASFTPRSVTLSPSTLVTADGKRVWQGGWVITLGLGGSTNAKCMIGVIAR